MASHFDRITIDPDICNGKPVVRGLRITVETILDYLSAGETRRRLDARTHAGAGGHPGVPRLRQPPDETQVQH
jgi:hypothetical protein